VVLLTRHHVHTILNIELNASLLRPRELGKRVKPFASYADNAFVQRDWSLNKGLSNVDVQFVAGTFKRGQAIG
jgi:hypothetical protein